MGEVEVDVVLVLWHKLLHEKEETAGGGRKGRTGDVGFGEQSSIKMLIPCKIRRFGWGTMVRFTVQT